ncbi:MAG: DUF393 domain-containing protein [Pirellulaceae bacterium]
MVEADINQAELLPAPGQADDSILVIFDGHCQFCSRQVLRLHRWDGKGRLRFLSLHDPRVSEWFPELTHEQLMEEMYVIDHGKHQYRGADGFRFLTTKLPRLWPLAPVLNFPFMLPVWSWCYRQIARQRYRWNKVTGQECEGACDVRFSNRAAPKPSKEADASK